MASFSNFATLSYRGGTLNSNSVTGEIVESVTVEKTAVSAGYGAGDSISYALSFVNSSAAALTDLSIEDDLGAYDYEGETLYPLAYTADTARLFVNGVLQSAPQVTAGPPLVFSGIDIPAGGSAVLVYETTVTPYAPLAPASVITNTATVTGGGVSVPVTASATVETMDGAALNVSKALSPAVVSGNGELSYSFEITNTGNTAAGADDEIVLSDVFNPILTGITVSFNGAAWTLGTGYSYDEGTGAFATLPGQITVPAAVYTQNPDGSWTLTPGSATLVVSGGILPQNVTEKS